MSDTKPLKEDGFVNCGYPLSEGSTLNIVQIADTDATENNNENEPLKVVKGEDDISGNEINESETSKSNLWTRAVSKSNQYIESKSEDRCFFCIWSSLCILFIGGWIAGFGYMIYFGTNVYKEASEYKQYSTEEQCILTGIHAVTDCTWQCDKYNSPPTPCECSNNCVCDTCDGELYQYTATVPKKCGNNSILTETSIKDSALSADCPETKKVINDTYTCYVLNCEDEQFSFQSPEEIDSMGIVWICVGSIMIGLPLLCCCLCYICNCKT